MFERTDARDGFDAADSRSDGIFADNFEYSDVADVAHVASAAEFFGVEAARGALVGNGDDTDVRFGIFVAEESERAGRERVVDRCDVGCDLRIAADLVVDLLLDVAEFFRVNRSEVRKVETQAVGRVERAGLLDVSAKNVA